jgi:L-alanine-DL-glutamate epimerase-like enolase superfamily enzyme
MALWDLVAKIADKPLADLIAERHRPGDSVDRNVFVYAAGGYYYPGKMVEQLQEEMRKYAADGFTTVKMKVGGATQAEDLRRIEAVLNVLPEGTALAVDANGRFDLSTAVSFGDAIAPLNLRWYEEPGDPLDYALHAELSAAYSGPLATGENLFSHQDTRNLARYGGVRPQIDVLQMDPALSYGLVEYLRMLKAIEEHGLDRRQCIPHGGHQFALAIAAGLGLGGNESYPGVFQPFGGFPDRTLVADGFVKLPEVAGIGFELKSDLYKIMNALVN